jgi:hypothetical protein
VESEAFRLTAPDDALTYELSLRLRDDRVLPFPVIVAVHPP